MALVVLFFAAVYALIGYASKGLFQDWCGVLFNYNYPLGDAAGIIAATFWPLGWPAIIIIGFINFALIVLQSVRNGFRQIRRSFAVIVNHYRENERGEQ